MERATQQPGLIDTDILIDASRGMTDAGSFLDDRQAGDGLTISVISAMELLMSTLSDQIRKCPPRVNLSIVKYPHLFDR